MAIPSTTTETAHAASLWREYQRQERIRHATAPQMDETPDSDRAFEAKADIARAIACLPPSAITCAVLRDQIGG